MATNVKPKLLYLEDEKKRSGLFSMVSGKHNDVYENFYDELIKIPENKPVDIIIKTHGGPALWCSKICYVLKNRTGKSRAFVKSYAHSAGAIIALAASEIYITYDTTLSAIDAQGSPLADLFQTSINGLSKLVESPVTNFVELNKARAQYFRESIEKFINDKHNKGLIMQKMHDESPIHEQLFFKEHMNDIGIVYNTWDGDGKNISKIPLI